MSRSCISMCLLLTHLIYLLTCQCKLLVGVINRMTSVALTTITFHKLPPRRQLNEFNNIITLIFLLGATYMWMSTLYGSQSGRDRSTFCQLQNSRKHHHHHHHQWDVVINARTPPDRSTTWMTSTLIGQLATERRVTFLEFIEGVST